MPAIPAAPAERRKASRMEPEKTKSRLAIALPWLTLALAAFFFFFYLQADNNLEPATPAGRQSEFTP